MKDDTEKLIEWVSKTRASEWISILKHRNAVSEILIEFWYESGLTGKRERRCYVVRRSPAGKYHSSVSGGQTQWTVDATGPNGEPIVGYREWCVSDADGGYIGSFESLDMLALMIVHQLNGKEVYAVSDTLVFA